MQRRPFLTCATALACALLLASGAAQAEVFINEFHYDDSTASGDTGERIEVVATAGETLSSYRVYLYNGSTPTAAVTYDNDLVPAGSLVTCGSQVRIATLSSSGEALGEPLSLSVAKSNAGQPSLAVVGADALAVYLTSPKKGVYEIWGATLSCR